MPSMIITIRVRKQFQGAWDLHVALPILSGFAQGSGNHRLAMHPHRPMLQQPPRNLQLLASDCVWSGMTRIRFREAELTSITRTARETGAATCRSDGETA